MNIITSDWVLSALLGTLFALVVLSCAIELLVWRRNRKDRKHQQIRGPFES